MSQSKPRANWTQLSHELWGAIFARLTQDIGDDDFLSSRLDEAGFHQLRLVCKIFKHILSSRERALEGLNVTAQQVQAQRSQQGSAQQGAAQQGAAQQGSAQPGPLQQGAAPQGPAQQGRLQQGAAQQGSAQPGPPQQGAASAQSQLPLTVSLMTAEQQQEQCVTMLTTVLKSVHAGLQLALPQQEAVVNTAVAVIGTTMAPLIKMLVTAEARHEQMYSAIQGVKADTTEVKKMMHSKASSNPLTAVAMAQGSQQMHGLGQCLSSRSSGSLSSASQAAVSPSKSPSPPLDTPARKLQQKNFKARELAKRQAQRLQDVLGTSGASASANAMTATAGRVVDGFKIVYPGSDGEVAWTSWGGRYVSGLLLSPTLSPNLMGVHHVSALVCLHKTSAVSALPVYVVDKARDTLVPGQSSCKCMYSLVHSFMSVFTLHDVCLFCGVA